MLSDSSFHRHALVRAPAPDHRDRVVIDSLNAHVNIFSGVRCVRSADDFILSGLVGEPVPVPQIHRQDAGRAGRRRR
jgi:hypothetical protein